PDNGLLAGQFGGEAVLLARHGNEVFAIGATCTHYQGPLAEGLKVGDTIRCPWHHACFSLRTGDRLRAPALDPVPCYRVEQSEGRIFVREKLARKAPERRATTSLKRIGIVGGGAAGNAAAETLRAEGYGGEITLFSADGDLPCDRPNLSKDFLAGSAPEEWVTLRSADFYREHKITIELGKAVAGLDARSRTLRLAGGERHAFDAIVLATGALPRRLDVPGAKLAHVRTLRSLADCRGIISAAAENRPGEHRNVVVIGASFIGLEAAAALNTRGASVSVVAPERVPMERVLGADLGKFIQELHEEHGVTFHLGTGVASISEREVALANGRRLPADLVLCGVGVAPETSLATAAGLSVGNGVLVDQFLETSAPGIFAAGDIASWPDRLSGERLRIEHWVVAERQGAIAAGNILGKRERCNIVPFFWTQQYDVSVSYVGHAQNFDRAELDGSPSERDCRVSYFSQGRKRAVATIFRDGESLAEELAFEKALAAAP
ncbi:MAG: FAD-dependent oxidoreductase, partial [Acetobacteraceae bacterium]